MEKTYTDEQFNKMIDDSMQEKRGIRDYITERRFSMLDFFLLMCMISIPSIVYSVVNHWLGY